MAVEPLAVTRKRVCAVVLSGDQSLPALRGAGFSSHPPEEVRLMPLPHLEWSLATEREPVAAIWAGPASARRGWVHLAAESRVLRLFRKLGGAGGKLPAPWWLRALDREQLASREAAFALEDEVHALLTARPGWVFVPWGTAGEIGYWEYGPSDRPWVKSPTTVTMTDRHPGWINVIPAHAEEAEPVPIRGVTDLTAALPRIEAW